MSRTGGGGGCGGFLLTASAHGSDLKIVSLSGDMPTTVGGRVAACGCSGVCGGVRDASDCPVTSGVMLRASARACLRLTP